MLVCLGLPLRGWWGEGAGTGPEEVMLKLDPKDDEGSQAAAGMEEENRRCGSSL